MKKFFWLVLSVVSVLGACSNDNIDGSSQNSNLNAVATEEVPSTTEVNSIDESYKEYSMNNFEYSILESWIEEVSDENLKYYYPEDGMLMVAYTKINDIISNEESREEFLDGFTSSLESFELVSESEIMINNIKAYRYDLNIVTSNQEFQTSLVIFDCYNGIASFYMTTSKDSGTDYSNEFENILNSIEITDNEDKEIEEIAEESTEKVIVLGKPIELGEYTLTIQKYSLGVDYEGDNALIIEYDWINNSEDSTSPFMTFMLKGFQDDVETDDVFMVEGVDLGIGQKEVRPGGVIKRAQSTVGISDMTKPLELELDELFSFDSQPYIATIDLSTLE